MSRAGGMESVGPGKQLARPGGLAFVSAEVWIRRFVWRQQRPQFQRKR